MEEKQLAESIGRIRTEWRMVYEIHYSPDLRPEIKAVMRAIDGALEAALAICRGG